MKKYRKFIMIFLLFSAFISFGYAAENKSAPAFQLMDLNDKLVSLNDYKDKQAVILFFWTTWCPYCREELKQLNQEYAGFARDSIELLAINVGEPKYKVEPFVLSHKLNFEVLLDKDSLVADAYELMGVPTYVVVNKSGQIVSAGNHFPKEALKEVSGK